jgi:hypothetical protein
MTVLDEAQPVLTSYGELAGQADKLPLRHNLVAVGQ